MRTHVLSVQMQMSRPLCHHNDPTSFKSWHGVWKLLDRFQVPSQDGHRGLLELRPDRPGPVRRNGDVDRQRRVEDPSAEPLFGRIRSHGLRLVGQGSLQQGWRRQGEEREGIQRYLLINFCFYIFVLNHFFRTKSPSRFAFGAAKEKSIIVAVVVTSDFARNGFKFFFLLRKINIFLEFKLDCLIIKSFNLLFFLP